MRRAAKRVINICIISTVLLLITCSNSSTFAAWPEVKEVKESYHFENVDEAGFDITISGINGQALYELKCHNADYEKDKDFNYSGAFECRLKSLYSKEAVSTLLTVLLKIPFKKVFYLIIGEFFVNLNHNLKPPFWVLDYSFYRCALLILK